MRRINRQELSWPYLSGSERKQKDRDMLSLGSSKASREWCGRPGGHRRTVRAQWSDGAPGGGRLAVASGQLWLLSLARALAGLCLADGQGGLYLGGHLAVRDEMRRGRGREGARTSAGRRRGATGLTGLTCQSVRLVEGSSVPCTDCKVSICAEHRASDRGWGESPGGPVCARSVVWGWPRREGGPLERCKSCG